MNKILSIRLTDDIWKEIEKIAKKKNLTKTEVVKRILIRDLIK